MNSINVTKELVDQEFSISDLKINEGDYTHSELAIIVMTNSNKKISLSTRTVIGGYFGGKRVSNNASLKIRSGDNEDLNAVLTGLSLSYSFTPRMFLQSLIQYNNVSNLFSINTRFGLLKSANNGLFVVLNILKDEDILYYNNNQRFTIKYSHTFDLIK